MCQKLLCSAHQPVGTFFLCLYIVLAKFKSQVLLRIPQHIFLGFLQGLQTTFLCRFVKRLVLLLMEVMALTSTKIPHFSLRTRVSLYLHCPKTIFVSCRPLDILMSSNLNGKKPAQGFHSPILGLLLPNAHLHEFSCRPSIGQGELTLSIHHPNVQDYGQ